MNPALRIIKTPSATGKPRHRIHHGRHFVTVARHAKGWRFGYKDGDRWRYITRQRFEDITRDAGRILAAKEAGLDFVALPEAAQAFLAEVHRLAPDPATRQAVMDLLTDRQPARRTEATPERFTVCPHAFPLTIEAHADGWRFRDPATGREIRRKHKADIITAAEKILDRREET